MGSIGEYIFTTFAGIYRNQLLGSLTKCSQDFCFLGTLISKTQKHTLSKLILNNQQRKIQIY